jgi:hypothetical protein
LLVPSCRQLDIGAGLPADCAVLAISPRSFLSAAT